MTLIIDTPTNVKTHLTALKRASVSAIMRYEVRPPGGAWKRLQPDEARAIGDVGLDLGLVYEGAGNRASYFSHATGYKDAAYARGRVDVYGQPEHSCVYFAVDFDARVSEVTNYVIPYFEGVNEAFSGAGPKLRIGCYGSGTVNTELLRRKLIDLRWITCSLGFRGSRAAVRTKQYELWQTKCDKRLLGIDVDFNVANVKDWGQFIPFSKASAIRKRGAGAQVHRRSRI